MNGEQEKIILDMVGTQGLADLEAIARIISEGKKEMNFSNPYYVAIRLLHQGIDQARVSLADAIGISK